ISALDVPSVVLGVQPMGFEPVQMRAVGRKALGWCQGDRRRETPHTAWCAVDPGAGWCQLACGAQSPTDRARQEVEPAEQEVGGVVRVSGKALIPAVTVERDRDPPPRHL